MMEHKGTVILETKRLVLRKFTEYDIKPIFRNWASKERVTEYLRWKAHSDILETEEVTKRWIARYKKPNFYQWAIVPKSVGEPIGTIAISDVDEIVGKVRVSYCIGDEWWNQDYTSEALARVIKFFFEEVKANRIEALHDSENPASGMVLQKCGMQFEGLLKQAEWNNRGIIDACIYGLVAEDYKG